MARDLGNFECEWCHGKGKRRRDKQRFCGKKCRFAHHNHRRAELVAIGAQAEKRGEAIVQ